jgi:hypothetical protein
MPPASRFWPSPSISGDLFPRLLRRPKAQARMCTKSRNSSPIVHDQLKLVQMETVSEAKVIDDGQENQTSLSIRGGSKFRSDGHEVAHTLKGVTMRRWLPAQTSNLSGESHRRSFLLPNRLSDQSKRTIAKTTADPHGSPPSPFLCWRLLVGGAPRWPWGGHSCAGPAFLASAPRIMERN